MIKVVDLFSGCGGLSLGFQNAGFDIVAAFDNWQFTIDTYSKNFNHPIINLDLSLKNAYKEITKYSYDMIIGGPPCQDFSSAGKRNEDGDRGNLTISFANIIKQVRPKFFLMENVARITKTNKLKKAIDIFKESGYGLSHMIFDASLCGVPQQRKRFIMIGELSGYDNTLIPYFQKNLSKKSMTIRDYVGNSWNIEHYYRHPRNYTRRAIYSIDEPSATIRGVNRPLPKGYMGHKCDAMRVCSSIRALTTVERSQIQTFPANFTWVGNKTVVEQIIGNAVPVNLAKYVANCLNEYLDDKKRGRTIKNSLF
jgi:DNA (cytosine-5)-methyltransferase 1